MQPVRILLAVVGGFVALGVLKSVVERPRLRRPVSPVRHLLLPQHYNRLAAYYRIHAN